MDGKGKDERKRNRGGGHGCAGKGNYREM